jgi:hypothetical protein
MKNTFYSLILILPLAVMLSNCSSSPKSKPDLKSQDQAEKPPSLNDAEIRVIWIPDTIEDDKYIEGHFVHIIERPASWKKER